MSPPENTEPELSADHTARPGVADSLETIRRVLVTLRDGGAISELDLSTADVQDLVDIQVGVRRVALAALQWRRSGDHITLLSRKFNAKASLVGAPLKVSKSQQRLIENAHQSQAKTMMALADAVTRLYEGRI